MSNSKSAIQEIKKLMTQFGFLAEEKTLQSFKLEDETILQTEKLEKGMEIYKINEAFEQVSLEDGVYRLKENFEVEVKEGKIEVVKEIFLEAKLADGTIIKVDGDTLVEGAKVVVVQDDAEVPAPDGKHELEDGTIVETKDGTIVSVNEGEAETPQEKEAPEGDVIETEPVMGAGDMSHELMGILKDFIQKASEKMSQMEEQMNSLNAEFKSFKAEPAAKKIADGKTENFNKQNKDDNDARINAIMSLRTNKKD